jgi:hypothetical protein
MIETLSNPDALLAWATDPWTGLTVAFVLMALLMGVLWSKQALSDILHGRWD